ncbi:hypothetical protein [Amphritea pacifica]|uniref:Uncharacterized protein n=1 Tax=Amphritea pacifica TaxID=2811233 RepID=A0ABS2WBX8_9GAMM|nr:hypothetical protein [Amphritea pacifica]MBN0989225.1 hypothetical protein [Amphritea pacifica]MBN1008544.1 hypothetical protein [Amphritea pacifica]
MKSFLRENPTIAFGLGLPLLLVVLFLLISGIPALLVAPPQYDLLFATEYYNYQNGVQISVINRSVQVIDLGKMPNNQKPRIWRYKAKTGGVQEIAYVLPPGQVFPGQSKPASTDGGPDTRVIDLPDLQGVAVDSSSIAPDGYEFSVANNRSRNVFGDLFYASGYRHQAVLSKGGRSIPLPNMTGQYYRGNAHFIGWIVSP